MTFDPSTPSKLKNTQTWFASIITRGIDADSRMNPISPTGELMEEEAWKYIKPSPTLRPAQRIEIYNQQYWWRLLGIMQETFPLLTRLFGYNDFNHSIAFPYLQKYPPNSWSLSELGAYLVEWVITDYDQSDKELIRDAAEIDWAYNRTFLAKECPPLDADFLTNTQNPSDLIECPLYLQPHLHLFILNYDLFTFRLEFLKQEPEYWVENDFPPLEKTNHWVVLFRNPHNDLIFQDITESEFRLLSYFQQGSSISQACQWIEEQKGDLQHAASKNIHTWLQAWAIKKWLTASAPSTEG